VDAVTRRAAAVAAVAGALLVAAAALAGCAPGTGRVHHVPDSDVPFGLMSPTHTGTGSTPPRGPLARIYLLRGDRLAPVSRRVVGANLPAEAVRELLKGPDPADIARGVSTAVPANTHLLSLDVAGGTATVDLSTEFGALGGDLQTEAVAQIVYTITDSRFVRAVRFAINGKPIEVPDGTGSLSATAMQRSNYPTLAPR
jgi:hypothetical protein